MTVVLKNAIAISTSEALIFDANDNVENIKWLGPIIKTSKLTLSYFYNKTLMYLMIKSINTRQ